MENDEPVYHSVLPQGGDSDYTKPIALAILITFKTILISCLNPIIPHIIPDSPAESYRTYAFLIILCPL